MTPGHSEPPKMPVLNTIPQVLARYGMSRSKLYEKIAEGAIDAVKLDGRTMIPEASLQAFVASLPRSTIGSKVAA